MAAAEAAVTRLGWAPVSMASFTAADAPAAELCESRVRDCDVYVAILGFRYGSPARDDDSRSYVELEFDAATAAGIPRLVFVVDGDAPEFVAPQSFWAEPMFGSRQEVFRARVDEAGLVRARVSGPQQLETLVVQALHELSAPESPPVRGPRFVVPALDGREVARRELAEQLIAALVASAGAGSPRASGSLPSAVVDGRTNAEYG